MTAEQSPRVALQRIPGWEQASWTELGGGLTNRAWLVDMNGQRAVLKIDAEPRSAPFNDRREEARIQQLAAERGLANEVLFASETTYLTEYVDGEIWGTQHFSDDARLNELAHALKRVHTLPTSGRRFDAFAAATEYIKNMGDADPRVADRCVQVVRSMRTPDSVACCHNDLVVENILDVGGLRFLDWEYACDNDPLFDLATLVSHHKLSKKQTNTLLNFYFDGDAARWQSRLDQQIRLYEALYWLWRAARSCADIKRIRRLERAT